MKIQDVQILHQTKHKQRNKNYTYELFNQECQKNFHFFPCLYATSHNIYIKQLK